MTSYCCHAQRNERLGDGRAAQRPDHHAQLAAEAGSRLLSRSFPGGRFLRALLWTARHRAWLLCYNRAPRGHAGNESRVAPGQMPGGSLCTRTLVKLFGQLPILGRVLTDCLEERIAFTHPNGGSRTVRGREVAELRCSQG